MHAAQQVNRRALAEQGGEHTAQHLEAVVVPRADVVAHHAREHQSEGGGGLHVDRVADAQLAERGGGLLPDQLANLRRVRLRQRAHHRCQHRQLAGPPRKRHCQHGHHQRRATATGAGCERRRAERRFVGALVGRFLSSGVIVVVVHLGGGTTAGRRALVGGARCQATFAATGRRSAAATATAVTTVAAAAAAAALEVASPCR
mmetsp:Transcript_36991/g.92747  ORF Transcript_36991/g.92747 Transcript_36991/m.92747 type:complete len:203 (+) Transcript_36991:3280-3888(+)